MQQWIADEAEEADGEADADGDEETIDASIFAAERHDKRDRRRYTGTGQGARRRSVGVAGVLLFWPGMRALGVAMLLLLVTATGGTSLAGDEGEATDGRSRPPSKKPEPPSLIEIAPVQGAVETLERLRLHPGRDALDVSETARSRQPATHR